MKDFVKLPQVSSGETYSEAQNYNISLNEHYITAKQTFNNPSGVISKIKWNSGSLIS